MNQAELAITVTADLYDSLRDEARRLDVPLEWLVASIIVDSMESLDEMAPELEPALCS